MVEVAHRPESLGNLGGTAEATVPFWSSVFTSVALASVALGLALLVMPGPRVMPEIPVALFAIALATLSGVLAASRGVSFASPRRSPLKSPEPSPNSTGALLSPPEGNPPPVTRSSRPPLSGKGSSWRILSAATDPGDETWLSWLPRERRRLVPEPGSVAAGVVTSPGRAGNLVAFPVRDYYGGALPPVVRASRISPPTGAMEKGFVGDELLPRPTSPRAAPFSEEELDRMFPPEGPRGSVFLPTAPIRIGGASARAKPNPPAGTSASPTGKVTAYVSISSTLTEDTLPEKSGSSPYGSSGRKEQGLRGQGFGLGPEELSREAANPVPPHLRASGPLIRFDPSRPPRGGKSATESRSVCASCSKVVVNLRMSGPCPKCLRPLCNECLREAFVTQGHGWCLDCSSAVAAS